ncbi:MAG: CDGSH iron-sulfur domain-containing protein [Streptosporangiaceae bacterium]|nr:CDGSH iron-sulfur domain-containing protein [Streptosporangiaceae bacterium]
MTGRGETRRVWHERGGPVLVEGPVEIVTEDGTVIGSDRPVVALCACGRSKLFPFCDTSHRRRVKEKPSQRTSSQRASSEGDSQ